MNKFLIPLFLVIISCTSSIEEESVSVPVTSPTLTPTPETEIVSNNKNDGEMKYNPVSYTHLTLPTICSV